MFGFSYAEQTYQHQFLFLGLIPRHNDNNLSVSKHVVLYDCKTWSLSHCLSVSLFHSQEQHRLSMFENRESRTVFGSRRHEITDWRKLHNDGFQNYVILLG
jgi:hypothetical protein